MTDKLVALRFRVELELGNVGFLGEGKTEVPGIKPLRARMRNQQQTQPTYDTEYGNQTQAILVGGKCRHHCAIPATPFIIYEELVNRQELTDKNLVLCWGV